MTGLMHLKIPEHKQSCAFHFGSYPSGAICCSWPGGRRDHDWSLPWGWEEQEEFWKAAMLQVLSLIILMRGVSGKGAATCLFSLMWYTGSNELDLKYRCLIFHSRLVFLDSSFPCYILSEHYFYFPGLPLKKTIMGNYVRFILSLLCNVSSLSKYVSTWFCLFVSSRHCLLPSVDWQVNTSEKCAKTDFRAICLLSIPQQYWTDYCCQREGWINQKLYQIWLVGRKSYSNIKSTFCLWCNNLYLVYLINTTAVLVLEKAINHIYYLSKKPPGDCGCRMTIV